MNWYFISYCYREGDSFVPIFGTAVIEAKNIGDMQTKPYTLPCVRELAFRVELLVIEPEQKQKNDE